MKWGLWVVVEDDVGNGGGGSQYHFDVLPLKVKRRLMADEATANSSLVLAQDRTRRKDPLDNFNRYTGGWNISDQHYIAVSSLSFLLLFFLFHVVEFSGGLILVVSY